MPLVTRIVDQKSETTHGVIHAEHTFFVPAKQKRPTDKIADPSPDQLADLAYRFPQEPSGIGKLTFAQLAKQRKIKPFEPAPEEPETADDEQLAVMANMAVKMFPTLKDKDALELIEQTQDAAVLKALFQAELDTDNPREKVVKAFKAKGLKIIEPAGDEPIDDGEPGQGEA
jgi:hypothetical protein